MAHHAFLALRPKASHTFLVLHPKAESVLWRRRYENALEKANYASLALKQEQEQEQAADAEDEEELQVICA